VRGKRGPAKGAKQKTGKTDIKKHACVPEVERTVMSPGKPKVTYLRCKTCHVSMGTR
jgi:hypothetical protein